MPLTRSPMRDAIAASMVNQADAQQGQPSISLAPPIRPQAAMRPPQMVGSSRPAVFAGGGAVTQTPMPAAAPAASASAMALQGLAQGYRAGRQAQPTPADPFAQPQNPFELYGGVGSVY